MTMPPLTDLTFSGQIADILVDLGVHVSKVGDREITGKCPVHKRVTGHEDSHPSWSMNAESGLWICFSCGARGTLPMLASELSGGNLDFFGIQKLIVNSSFERLTQTKEEQEEELDVSAFFNFHRVSDKRCASRSLDPDITYSYGVRWNTDHKAWSIPIMHSTGRLMGWQEKKTGYVRNFPIGVEKSNTLFGIERFRSKTAVLVESPLDVVRFAGVFDKPQALASFGAYVSSVQLRILTYVADTVVIAMDNDKAGREACKRLYKTMSTPRKGVRWWNYDGMDVKDIGDMTDDQIERGLATATIIPPWIG